MFTAPSTTTTCPVCGSQDLLPLIDLPDVPVHIGRQWRTAELARTCPRGDIALRYCRVCQHAFNTLFDPTLIEYTEEYDNSLDHSPRFRDYLTELAETLVTRYDLHDKDIIEIGCGKGRFLALLAELGDNRGIGFDPSADPSALRPDERRKVTLVQEYYAGDHADRRADFICCRHVLEHIPDPVGFLQSIRGTLRPGESPILYFEVPNLSLILRDLSVWDVIYEHVSVFSLRSLAAAFLMADFRILDLYESYDGQFLSIEVTPASVEAPLHSPSPQPSPNGTAEPLMAASEDTNATSFRDRVAQRTSHWAHFLERAEREDTRTVLWGGGSKAVGFLNLLGLRASAPAGSIDYVVDINPNKHGRFLPGTGQEIVPPSFLQEYRPENVVIMNPIYRDEIGSTLRDLGITPTLHCAS